MQIKKRAVKISASTKKPRFVLIKRLIGLMSQGAKKEQYWLEIGTYFLRKGTGHKVGDIVQQRYIGDGRFKVKVITGLFFDFNTNKVNHTAENRIVKQ